MENEKMARIFKALSNEQRLNLYKMLCEWNEIISDPETATCCGVDKSFTRACHILKLSKSTVSHHFKELQNAGLIVCTRNGQSATCTINKEVIEEIKKFLG